MKKVSMAIAVAATVGAAGASWLTGARVETQFRDQMEAVAAGGVQVRVLEYDRGLLRSTARSLWILDDGTSSFRLQFRHHLTHGPVLTTDLAVIRSEVELSDAMRDRYALILQDRSPLELSTRVKWNGDHEHVLSSPPFGGRVDDTDLKWGGLHGTMAFSAGAHRAFGRLDAPSLTLQDARTDLRIDRISLELNTRRAPEFGFWIGPLSATIGNMAVLDATAEEAVEARQVRLDADSTLENDLVRVTTSIGAEFIAAAGQAIEDFELRVALGRLDAGVVQTLTRLSEELAASRLPAEQQGQALFAALLRETPTLLSRAPYMEIERLGGRLPEGGVWTSARIAYVGAPGSSGFNPFTDLEALLRISLPREVLRGLVEERQRAALAPYAAMFGWDEASDEYAQVLDENVRSQIEEFAAAGLIVEDGSAWVSEARYATGAFSLNGEPADALFHEWFGAILR